MAAYIVAMVIALWSCFPATYQQWLAWVAHPVVNVTTAVFFISLMFHAWVGMRDVVVDYVKPVVLRFSLLVLLGGSLLFMGVWSIRILFSV